MPSAERLPSWAAVAGPVVPASVVPAVTGVSGVPTVTGVVAALPAVVDPAPGGSRGRHRGARKGWGTLGAVGLVLAGGISVQFGGALAVTLLPRAGAFGIVTLRLVAAAVIMLLVCRPKVRGYSRGDWGVVLLFGVTMAAMNGLFYQAIGRIPLGPAVTLEVLGPLVLSVVASRRALNLAWAGLALAGVFLLGGGGFNTLDPVGVAYALGAGVMWAAYIILSSRTGRRFPQADGLALAMVVAAVVFLPLGVVESGEKLLDPTTAALGAAVGVLSSVLPYTLELLALRRLPSSTFAVLMSLEPAVAALAGFLILNQTLSAPEALAISLVIVASMGAVRTQVRRKKAPAVAVDESAESSESSQVPAPRKPLELEA